MRESRTSPITDYICIRSFVSSDRVSPLIQVPNQSSIPSVIEKVEVQIDV